MKMTVTQSKSFAGPWVALFNTAYLIFGVLYFPFFLKRLKQAEDGRRLFRERLGRVKKRLSGKNTVWIHAVSVGEVMAVKKLTEDFLKRFPEKTVFLTTVTPTGQKIAKGLENERVQAAYFPFDFTFACRSFMKEVRPDCILTVETEIWPNFLSEAARAGVPVGVLNARLSDKSASRYGAFRFLFRRLFEKLSFVLAQTEKDASRFEKMGVPKERVHVLGNIKYDNAVFQEFSAEQISGLKRKWGFAAGDLIWIAGSTHPGEEETVLKVFKNLRRDFKNLKLILAPRHPERAGAIKSLVEKQGLACRFSTEITDPGPKSETVMILNEMGVLKHLYPMAEAVFMGGSFVRHGGQNPIEPSGFKKAVFHGPHVFNFEFVYETLDRNKGAVRVESAEALELSLQGSLRDVIGRQEAGEKAFATVSALQGATARHLNWLESFWNERIQHVEHENLFPPAGGRV